METDAANVKGEEQEERPRGQVLFDNIPLWFILSLLFSLLLYNGWGLVELLLVPPFP
jgi:hypothetical protein